MNSKTIEKALRKYQKLDPSELLYLLLTEEGIGFKDVMDSSERSVANKVPSRAQLFLVQVSQVALMAEAFIVAEKCGLREKLLGRFSEEIEREEEAAE